MRALVLLSGGVDSSTALGIACREYGSENVVALSIVYGQKHQQEINAAVNVAKHYGVEHLYLDLSQIFKFSDCSLLSHSSKEIPHVSYDEQIKHTNGAPVSTYVPFRNGLFISSAASLAISKNCDVIYYGAHRDDACGNAYPDCSEGFNNAMNEAVYIGSGNSVRIVAPFVNVSKKDIVRMGLEIGVPYELTWSCYEGHEKPCGCCGTCIDRRKAFLANGVVDPLEEM